MTVNPHNMHFSQRPTAVAFDMLHFDVKPATQHFKLPTVAHHLLSTVKIACSPGKAEPLLTLTSKARFHGFSLARPDFLDFYLPSPQLAGACSKSAACMTFPARATRKFHCFLSMLKSGGFGRLRCFPSIMLKSGRFDMRSHCMPQQEHQTRSVVGDAGRTFIETKSELQTRANQVNCLMHCKQAHKRCTET